MMTLAFITLLFIKMRIPQPEKKSDKNETKETKKNTKKPISGEIL